MNKNKPFNYISVYIVLVISFLLVGFAFLVLAVKPVLGLILSLTALGGFAWILNKLPPL